MEKKSPADLLKIPLVSFAVDRMEEASLQKQIQTIVVNGILSGKFLPGAKMPSSRALADYLGISRMTVTLAYSELIANDYLITKDRSGYFISQIEITPLRPDRRTAPIEAEPKFIPKFARHFVINRREIERPENWREYPYRFIYGQADPTILDHHRWRQCSIEALGRRDFNSLILDSYERDDPMLTNYLLNVTLPRRGIYAQEDEILITVGAQNALWLSAQILLSPESLAIIENPCYPGLRNILTNQGCALQSLDVDQAGLPVSQIPANSTAIFVTPNHQSPTNVIMNPSRRGELLNKANEEGFMIIEDDYEYEINHLQKPAAALKSLDQNGHVIYVGSFSKSLFPGLRLGFMVASAEIIKEARALRGLVLRHPPSHSQRTVAYFQSLGYFDSLLNRISAHFTKRHQAMVQAIEDYKLESASPLDQGGYSFWMKTDPSINTNTLAENLREKGVLIEAGASFFDPKTPKQNYYRLAYSNIEASKIPGGIRLIREEINRITS